MTDRPSNVLLLVLDSLRFDRLSCYGYDRITTPFLDSLSTEGVRVEQAYSTAPWTVPAHGSLFTGLLPSYHGSHQTNKKFEQPADATLAGVLSESGYQTVGFSTNPWIAPEFNFDRGFDHFEFLAPEPPFQDEETTPEANLADLGTAETVREVLAWASRGSPGKRLANGLWKTFTKSSFVDADQLNDAILESIATECDDEMFLFANYMDVHDPHYDNLLRILDDGDPSTPSLQPDPATSRLQYPFYSERVSFQEEPARQNRARQLYDEAAQRLDRKLDELFTALDDHIDLEDTLTIVLGDHGECLGEHSYWGHSTFLHEELVRVPLIVRPPAGSDPGPIEETTPTSLIDLPGYVAERCGSAMSENARSVEWQADERPIFAECTAPRPDMEGKASRDGYRAVVANGWKLVRNLETDETELTQISRFANSNEKEQRERLLDLEHDWWSDEPFQPTEETRGMSQETKTRLSDLGYI
jgi:arylsulfatase A-like enzyme